MNQTKEPHQGWRYFHCDECDRSWREATRDFKSPSQTSCHACQLSCAPTHGRLDESLPVDEHGNLTVILIDDLRDKLIDCTPRFKVGDKIKFVNVTRSGRSINLKATKGVIEKFSLPAGTKALVKYAGGNRVWKLVKDLEPEAGPSPLNKLTTPKENA